MCLFCASILSRINQFGVFSAIATYLQSSQNIRSQPGRKTFAGIAIGIPLRRKDVADIAGTTLHTASRLLSAWEKAGILVNRKRMLTVARMADLRAIAED
jgi:CRP-like cAMP-binding protein